MPSGANPFVVNLYDLLICLTNAGDLISPEVTDHHQRVAYLAFRIGEQLQLPPEQKKDLMLAGLLHDIGAFSLEDRLALNGGEPPSAQNHAVAGALLLEDFAPLSGAADCIRHHHVSWDNGAGKTLSGRDVSPLSHILHLADRAAVLVDPRRNVIEQVDGIRKAILGQKGTAFVPEQVDAFMELSDSEYIWLDAVYQPLLYILPDITSLEPIDLDIGDIIRLTGIFANTIDFRNPFTATHSTGVARTASALAGLAGFSEKDCGLMQVAGNLHDLGKLAVSKNILEKAGDLDTDDVSIVRSHTFYTYRLLQPIKAFETIGKWAGVSPRAAERDRISLSPERRQYPAWRPDHGSGRHFHSRHGRPSLSNGHVEGADHRRPQRHGFRRGYLRANRIHADR